MKLTYKPYTIALKREFTLSSGSRTTTPAVLVEIEHEGVTGYGEASMPPYLGETTESVIKYLNKIDLKQFKDLTQFDENLNYIDVITDEDFAAKASVDIALHDLYGKLIEKPCYEIYNVNPDYLPESSYTLGISTPNEIRVKLKEAESFNLLKIKIGSENNREIIKIIRNETDKFLCADVNEGWSDKEYAIDMIHFLTENYTIFIEQPLPKEMIDESAWLKEKSPIPVIADESIKTMKDMKRLKDVYSGVNVKLQKCGGIRNSYRLMKYAKENNLKVLIGCMTETSCGISAAAQLAGLADWADLDGALLIKNDPFRGTEITNGKIIIPQKFGIGAEKR